MEEHLSIIVGFLARNEELGAKAVRELEESNVDARNKVRFHQLDITNVESIRRLADYIRRTHGGLDILVNNAAMAFKVMPRQMFEEKLFF